MPQTIAQIGNNAYRRLIPAFAHEGGDGIQRVEEEMRLDLLSHGLELGLRQQLVQARAFGCLHDLTLSRLEQLSDHENRPVQKQPLKYAIDKSLLP